MPEKKFYLIPAQCDNCGHCQRVRIPFGTLAARALAQEECATCGCTGMKRAWGQAELLVEIEKR